MTRTGEQSLRVVVEKWLAFKPLTAARVTAFGRTASGERRYVCVETTHNGEQLALFFFRHDDGCWRVFPAAPTLPELNLERLAA
ncbi:hypothetical protein BZM27_50485 [Paraburkholderia steynii]|uniref:Uncharacterized protein n=1 Tax=Paraburkholderia steynii TaxID=1245441 RepID=A0A4R0X8L1_9BURK|nr:hypothetical protein BZM27_50485 [Paraburkholderia steynii]